MQDYRIVKLLLLFYKTITLWFLCLYSLILTLGNVAQAKKSVQNHARFRALLLTLATFPRVWIRPSKHGNHKVIVYALISSSSISIRIIIVFPHLVSSHGQGLTS